MPPKLQDRLSLSQRIWLLVAICLYLLHTDSVLHAFDLTQRWAELAFVLTTALAFRPTESLGGRLLRFGYFVCVCLAGAVGFVLWLSLSFPSRDERGDITQHRELWLGAWTFLSWTATAAAMLGARGLLELGAIAEDIRRKRALRADRG